MAKDYLQLDIIASDPALPVTGQPERTELLEIVPAIDSTLDTPLRMHAAFPTPDSKVYFEPSEVVLGNGVGRSLPVINNTIPSAVASTFDFQTGIGAGAPFSGSIPASTVGFFRRVGFILLDTGTISITTTDEAASLGAVDPAGVLFDKTIVGSYEGQPIGWVDVEATAINAYKTAGSATNVVENSVSSSPRVHIIPSVGSPPSGASTFDVNTILVDDVTGDVLTDDVLANVLTED